MNVKQNTNDSISGSTAKTIESVIIVLGLAFFFTAGGNSIIQNYTDDAKAKIEQQLAARQ